LTPSAPASCRPRTSRLAGAAYCRRRSPSTASHYADTPCALTSQPKRSNRLLTCQDVAGTPPWPPMRSELAPSATGISVTSARILTHLPLMSFRDGMGARSTTTLTGHEHRRRSGQEIDHGTECARLRVRASSGRVVEDGEGMVLVLAWACGSNNHRQ
jgi:hypothetical protein